MATPNVINSRKVFVVNDNVRGILCIYDAEPADKPGSVPRTFFKTFDKSIKVGDFLIVPTTTRHNMTVVKCVAVDVECEIELTTPCEWVVGIVDRSTYQRIVEGENEMLNTIRSAEKMKMRKELADAVLADAGDKVKTLAIAKMTDDDTTQG